jgi:NIPSNAP
MNRKRSLIVVLSFALSACAGGEVESADAAAGPPAASAQAPAEGRLYEMRTYTTHPGKLEDLERRFRDHTTRIFEKHGMVNVGYWVPQDTARAENTLIYILSYPDREARNRSWTAFREDPEWQSAQAASEENGPIVLRVESVFMDPTDFSALR